MPVVSVSWGMVIVAAVVSMVIGFVWYHPAVFGTTWMKLVGLKKEDAKGTNSAYLLMFISSLVLAYVMVHFVSYTNATTLSLGAVTGFWAWLGFVATTGLAKKAFLGTSWQLFAIDHGYHLVQFGVIGALLARY